MNFSSNIKHLRKRRKKTQEDVAFALGMKRSTLNNYENGQTIPKRHGTDGFSDYYRIAIDTILRVDLSGFQSTSFRSLKGAMMSISGAADCGCWQLPLTADNEENIELVNEKAKAGYVTGYADPEYIKELPVFRLPFLSGTASTGLSR
jgi:transcriptional regulator with XRE-family HTH domain